jgi:flagellar hook-associated protein 2
MSITIGGTFSGLDVNSIINAVIAADSIPITNLQTTDTNLTTNSTDLGDISTSLGELSSELQDLGSNSLFASKTTASSTTTVGSASADTTAASGSFTLNVSQLATATVLTSGSTDGTVRVTAAPAGTTNIATALGETGVDGQTFSINGKIVTLAGTDTVDDVMTKITNSGAGVTAAYDDTTGKITLTSGSPILLGSGADTSDFLKQAGLYNNATGTVTSSTGLGRVDPTTDLATAGLSTTPTTGTFTINGVSIKYNSGDSMNTLIGSINSSTAGVTAVYDTYEDQLVLTSNTRGPQSITVANGTSNIATALHLDSGDSSLSVGQSTLFSVNGGATRQSNSNVIDPSALGITGVSFTATGTGSTNVTISPDTSTIATAINAFVTQYNSTQSVIASYTSVDTADSTQDGALADDTNLTFLAPQLRSTTSDSISNTATIRMLSDIGIETNATDNTLTQVDSSKLQDALTNHLSDVEALFNDPTSGLTNSLQAVIGTYSNSLNGVIKNEQNDIADQISYNKQQITLMQENITAEQTQLENEFSTLDQVESQMADVSSILTGSSSSSKTSSSVGGVSGYGTTASGASSSTSSTSSSSSTSS